MTVQSNLRYQQKLAELNAAHIDDNELSGYVTGYDDALKDLTREFSDDPKITKHLEARHREFIDEAIDLLDNVITGKVSDRKLLPIHD